MEKKQEVMEYHSYDEVPVMLSAKDISALLKMPMSTVYFIFHAVDFPTITIGKRKFARKESLFRWIEMHENDISYLMSVNAGERCKELKKNSKQKGRKC